jgi:hypothetical protein
MRSTMRLPSSKAALLLAVLILPIGGMACDDDDPTGTPDDQPSGYPAATTRDQLVSNLARSFNERNYEEYETLLHADFVFYFSQDGGDDTWDRARELTYISRLFSGQPGEGPGGTPVPPVQKIQVSFTEEEPGAPWTDEVATEFDGTTMKRYGADMLLTYTDGTSVRVEGLQEFYAAPTTVQTKGGSVITVYQLKYWRDLGKAVTKASVGTETRSWGSWKSLF